VKTYLEKLSGGSWETERSLHKKVFTMRLGVMLSTFIVFAKWFHSCQKSVKLDANRFQFLKIPAIFLRRRIVTLQ
jgi:hypothetical protein